MILNLIFDSSDPKTNGTFLSFSAYGFELNNEITSKINVQKSMKSRNSLEKVTDKIDGPTRKEKSLARKMLSLIFSAK